MNLYKRLKDKNKSYHWETFHLLTQSIHLFIRNTICNTTILLLRRRDPRSQQDTYDARSDPLCPFPAKNDDDTLPRIAPKRSNM
mmetsp:Transcript_50368/g.60725  ORF Transcript_50368/g.60725 Transcript_50368/m.60725 type:complete len:84 (-) Transcript_50368:129-380(-)